MNKLYFVITDYSPGTANTNRFLSIIKGFSEMGIDIEVVFMLANASKAKVEYFLPHVKFTYLWESFPITNKYLRQIQYYINSLRFYKKLKYGDKVFVMDTTNMIDLFVAKKGVKVFNEQTENPLVYKIKSLNNKRYIASCPKLDGLFVISTALKEWFSRNGVERNKIHIVNMTVDSNRFEGVKKQNVQDKYIAYCGSMTNNKDGVDELIKAFALFSESYPNYKLYIIGKSPSINDDKSNLKLVENLGLIDKVVCTGLVHPNDMPQLLKNAEMLALARPNTIQAQYGFPTKLGEYLLTSNPVVITKTGDIPLFLEDGVSALLADERNPEQFAEKMRWVVEHPKEALAIGHKGQEVALQYFNYKKEANKIFHVISKD